MPQLPASAAATSRASKPAPTAIDPGPGQSIAQIANGSGGGVTPATFHGGGWRSVAAAAGQTAPRAHPFSQRMTVVAVKTAKKTIGLGADRRQENLQITDRGKPQPIDQEVAREPEQDQANPDDDGRNDEPDHGALPWCLPFGSGNPDRHGLIIAEMRDACRLIRGRDCPAKAGDAGARSSVAGTANEHKGANSADAAGAINQLSSRKALPSVALRRNGTRSNRVGRAIFAGAL